MEPFVVEAQFIMTFRADRDVFARRKHDERYVAKFYVETGKMLGVEVVRDAAAIQELAEYKQIDALAVVDATTGHDVVHSTFGDVVSGKSKSQKLSREFNVLQTLEFGAVHVTRIKNDVYELVSQNEKIAGDFGDGRVALGELFQG